MSATTNQVWMLTAPGHTDEWLCRIFKSGTRAGHNADGFRERQLFFGSYGEVRERVKRQGLNGGPSRARTGDLAIMSRVL